MKMIRCPAAIKYKHIIMGNNGEKHSHLNFILFFSLIIVTDCFGAWETRDLWEFIVEYKRKQNCHHCFENAEK